MIQQLIYRGTSNGYRAVAMSRGLRDTGLSYTLMNLSDLPSRFTQDAPVYTRTAMEAGVVFMATAIDKNGSRNHHISHIFYVPDEDNNLRIGCQIPPECFRLEYPDNRGVDALPEITAPAGSGLSFDDRRAARTLFGSARGVNCFIRALSTITKEPQKRGVKGVCVKTALGDGETSLFAYRLTEYILTLLPEWQKNGFGYRSLWTQPSGASRYPLFFASADMDVSKPMLESCGCALIDAAQGTCETTRGQLDDEQAELAALAEALFSGTDAEIQNCARQVRGVWEKQRREEIEAARREAERRQTEELLRREMEAQRLQALRQAQLEKERREAETLSGEIKANRNAAPADIIGTRVSPPEKGGESPAKRIKQPEMDESAFERQRRSLERADQESRRRQDQRREDRRAEDERRRKDFQRYRTEMAGRQSTPSAEADISDAVAYLIEKALDEIDEPPRSDAQRQLLINSTIAVFSLRADRIVALDAFLSQTARYFGEFKGDEKARTLLAEYALMAADESDLLAPKVIKSYAQGKNTGKLAARCVDSLLSHMEASLLPREKLAMKEWSVKKVILRSSDDDIKRELQPALKLIYSMPREDNIRLKLRAHLEDMAENYAKTAAESEELVFACGMCAMFADARFREGDVLEFAGRERDEVIRIVQESGGRTDRLSDFCDRIAKFAIRSWRDAT